MRTRSWATLGLCVALLASEAWAESPCTGFKWDVSKEVALFGTRAIAVIAGKALAAAPALSTGNLYQLTLSPQSDVTFATVPGGKKMSRDGAYGGVAVLKLDGGKSYRVAVDVPAWLDLLADGAASTVEDFSGHASCDGPHKIVIFDVPAARQYALQVSDAGSATVRITITQSPTAKN